MDLYCSTASSIQQVPQGLHGVFRVTIAPSELGSKWTESMAVTHTCRQGLDAIAALVHAQVAALAEHNLVRLHGVALRTDGTQSILIPGALLSQHIPHRHLTSPSHGRQQAIHTTGVACPSSP